MQATATRSTVPSVSPSFPEALETARIVPCSTIKRNYGLGNTMPQGGWSAVTDSLEGDGMIIETMIAFISVPIPIPVPVLFLLVRSSSSCSSYCPWRQNMSVTSLSVERKQRRI